MKKGIKIFTIFSEAILLSATVALAIILVLTLNAKNKMQTEINEMQTTIVGLNGELSSTKRQMEEYKQELDAYTPETTDSFASAADLINAVKHNPSYYNGKAVTVKGLILKDYDDIIVGNLKGLWSQMSETILRTNILKNPNIRVSIEDELQRSVVETGDRIKVYGTVTISDGEVYLDNCEYTMIETYEELLERMEDKIIAIN